MHMCTEISCFHVTYIYTLHHVLLVLTAFCNNLHFVQLNYFIPIFNDESFERKSDIKLVMHGEISDAWQRYYREDPSDQGTYNKY